MLAHSRGRAAVIAPFLAALTALALPAPALANGRYPAAGEIAVAPGHPATVLARASYGLMLSQDSGKTWGWIREPAVGYGGEEDPMMSFMTNGTLLAGTFEGLAEGTLDGCQWGFYPALNGKTIVDLSVDKVDPSRAVLVHGNGIGTDDGGAAGYQLWQTSDNGATWAQAGTDMPAAFLGVTVDTAPSNPMRVYVSGYAGPPGFPGVIQRSDDRGATWQELAIPGADATHVPYIGAVDPGDPDTVYVRLAGPACADPQDTLLVSKDGGMTWSAPLFTTHDGGNLLGFALSPDGSTVVVGSAPVVEQQCSDGPGARGLWRAPAATLAFAQLSSLSAQCLTWTPAGLYACAAEFADGFTAGISTDQGQTFQPLMHLGGICPLVCSEPDSGVTAQCPALWPMTATQISATGCGGSGTGGSASSTGSGTASASSGAPSSSGGTGARACSCSLPREAGGGVAALAALAGLATAIRWRRRR